MNELTAQQVVRDIEARMLGLTGANVTTWEMRILLAERRELLAQRVSAEQWKAVAEAATKALEMRGLADARAASRELLARQVPDEFIGYLNETMQPMQGLIRLADFGGNAENMHKAAAAHGWRALYAPASLAAADVSQSKPEAST